MKAMKWTFYSETLQPLMTKQGSQYGANPAGGIQLTPAFVSFFNKAARFSEAVYRDSRHGLETGRKVRGFYVDNPWGLFQG